MKRLLTWIKATWDWLHIWNYFWAFKPLVELSKDKETFLFLADYHSLTSVHNWETLRKNRKNILIEYLALLWDNENITVFEQSKMSRINDLTWVLSSVTPYSMMLRAHTFKDSKAKNSDINMATFNYPILMTSDIIWYDVDMVPVWKDQKQHLEFARDIAENFNKTYDVDFFKLPEPIINQEVQTIPWTDGRKMSKSYDNFIWIFDDEKTLKKKIMSIKTDDTTLEEPKNPDTCNVFAFIKLLWTKDKIEEIKQKYLAWNYGYWHAKLELLEIFLEYFWPARERKKLLEENPSILEKKLSFWNTKANTILEEKYNNLIKIIWLE